MDGNQFIVEILADGKVKITSTGGFSKEFHQDADEFLEFMKNLWGGECITKKLPKDLANPHIHGSQQNKLENKL